MPNFADESTKILSNEHIIRCDTTVAHRQIGYDFGILFVVGCSYFMLTFSQFEPKIWMAKNPVSWLSECEIFVRHRCPNWSQHMELHKRIRWCYYNGKWTWMHRMESWFNYVLCIWATACHFDPCTQHKKWRFSRKLFIVSVISQWQFFPSCPPDTADAGLRLVFVVNYRKQSFDTVLIIESAFYFILW